MSTSTKVHTVGFAAGLATVFMWLTGYFAPELMAEAPVGLEAAITGIFSVLTGYILKDNKPPTNRIIVK